jgi:hypothetical protein
LGVEFEYRKLGEDVFNEAGFRDPDGLLVTLVEARTYSPPTRAPGETSWCGYFTEFGIPTRDADRSKAFWEKLGFVAVAENERPFRRISLTSDFLDLGLYATRDLTRPVLTFIDPEMTARFAAIDKLNLGPAGRLPPSFDAASSRMLVAPEGTTLLLLTDDA